MTVTLSPFPGSTAPDLVIGVTASRPRRSALKLEYQVSGDVGAVKVPGWVKRSRADELWRTTCFEAFIARPDGGYVEINLSPSGFWAVYGFDGYREGMTPLAGVAIRDSARATDETWLAQTATLDLDRLGLPLDQPWRLGLSAVIETTDGAISYWALAHPSDKPDFHHPDSFVLELPPMEGQ